MSILSQGLCINCVHSEYCTLRTSSPTNMCEEFEAKPPVKQFKFEEMGIIEGQREWEKEYYKGSS